MENDGIAFENSADERRTHIDSSRRDDDGTDVFVRKFFFGVILATTDDESAFFGERTERLKDMQDVVAHNSICELLFGTPETGGNKFVQADRL